MFCFSIRSKNDEALLVRSTKAIIPLRLLFFLLYSYADIFIDYLKMFIDRVLRVGTAAQ